MKFYYLIIVFSLILFFNLAYSQNQTNYWFFGENAGLDFSSGKPIAITAGKLNSKQGCASICDIDGNLICYTDGKYIWNSKHGLITTSLKGNTNATQSSIILPNPFYANYFYLFTTAVNPLNKDSTLYQEGNLYRYELKMTDSTYRTGYLLSDTMVAAPMMPKLTAALHKNQHNYWVITHYWNTNIFLSYEVEAHDISTIPVVSVIGFTHTGDYQDAWGYIKASPDSKRLALASYGNNLIELYDFDNYTGKVSNPIQIKSDSTINLDGAYGVEFSADSKYLYISCPLAKRIYQFDLTYNNAVDLVKNVYVVDTTRKYALQLGPDKKIYAANLDSTHLSVINFPALKGDASNFKENGADLKGKKCAMGLPNFLPDFFHTKYCSNVSYSYPSFYSKDDFNYLVDAKNVDNSYISLTNLSSYSAGAFWYKQKVPVSNGFITTFKFRMHDGTNNGMDENSLPGGDGFAFVIQNSSENAIGNHGYGHGYTIGYEGIPNSLAIEFDMFENLSIRSYDTTYIIHDPNGNHIAVQSMGTKPNTVSHYTFFYPACMGKTETEDLDPIRSDGKIYYVKIEYNLDPGELNIWIDSSYNFHKPNLTISGLNLKTKLNLDNGQNAYIGFTSSTGQAYQNHDIMAWNYCSLSEDYALDVDDFSNNNENHISNLSLTPNPFSNETTIKYKLDNTAKVNLKIIDLNGKTIKEFFNEYQFPGEKEIRYNANDLAQGIYIVMLQIDDKLYSSSAVVVR